MDSNLNEKIQNIRNEFYQTNSKNILFKKTQKQECAKYISDTLQLQDLISHTVFLIPNTNIIFYNYLVFKQYGHESNCNKIMDYFKQLILQTIENFGHFELHFNLKSFSISALNRYSSIIQTSFDENILFGEKLSRVVVYYTPHFIELITIKRPFVIFANLP